ncbi:MAG: tautomerase family protein [Chitinophagaceae bacterium]|nr:tautomerase family protein [Rubrivivax sp.]
MPANLSPQRTRALADAAHEALVETCRVPARDRFQLIFRLVPEAMIIDPTFPDVRRTPETSIVEITLLEGRSAQQKRALYAQLATKAVAAGFVADDIIIALTENAVIDWSLGRGEAFAGHG